MLLDYVDFITGALSVGLVYALFKVNDEDEEEDLKDISDDIDHNESIGRTVILSCQTCRKQQRHKEIEYNLYQCRKCRRYIDLR